MNKTEFDEKYVKILEKFKALKSESEEDVQFSKATLEKHFDCTIKISKWLNKKSEWSSLYRSFEQRRVVTWKKVYEYYKKDYNLVIGTKEEFQMLINSDAQYSNISELTNLTKEIVAYIDEVIKVLRDRQWEIKNLIEWQKFLHGA